MIHSPNRNDRQTARSMESKTPGPNFDKYGKRKRLQVKSKRKAARKARRNTR